VKESVIFFSFSQNRKGFWRIMQLTWVSALEKKAGLFNDSTIPNVELAEVGEEVSRLLEPTPLQV
jgi:hypothetical protein